MMAKLVPALLPYLLSLPCLAQTTCFTDSHGTTLCSTPGGVIHGNTNSLGDSVYRDDRGNRLDYDVDQFGDVSVQRPSGETIEWSQPAPEDRFDPDNNADSQPPSGKRGAGPN